MSCPTATASGPDELTAGQLRALGRLHARLAGAGVDCWLFGGWAVDAYAGRITRAHDDVDLAVWLDDLPAIDALLEPDGWRHAPDVGDDGGTGYEREGVRLELTYLVRGVHGAVVTPLRQGAATWPDGAFGNAVGELQGVRVRLIGLDALIACKSWPRGDPADEAKDRADLEVLSRRRPAARGESPS